MNRVTFVAVYAIGVGAIWFAGSPWPLVNAMLMGSSHSRVILGAGFWMALLVPVVLMIVAAVRGRAAGRPWLFLFPVCAFGVSALAFAYGWLSRTVSGEEASLLPMPLAVAIGVASLFVPFVIHLVCCAIGAAQGRPNRAGPGGDA
jgi:hypothetical protein